VITEEEKARIRQAFINHWNTVGIRRHGRIADPTQLGHVKRCSARSLRTLAEGHRTNSFRYRRVQTTRSHVATDMVKELDLG